MGTELGLALRPPWPGPRLFALPSGCPLQLPSWNPGFLVAGPGWGRVPCRTDAVGLL